MKTKAMRWIVMGFFVVSGTAVGQAYRRNCAEGRNANANAERGGAAPYAFGEPFQTSIVLRSWVQGWHVTGQGYSVRCDTMSDCALPMLRSERANRDAAGTLAHTESGRPWRGMTVELRAELRAGQVSDRAGLWVRVEGPGGSVLFEENAQQSALTGTTGFTWKALRFTVPEQAERITFGVVLHGSGALYIREIQFDDAQMSLASR